MYLCTMYHAGYNVHCEHNKFYRHVCTQISTCIFTCKCTCTMSNSWIVVLTRKVSIRACLNSIRVVFLQLWYLWMTLQFAYMPQHSKISLGTKGRSYFSHKILADQQDAGRRLYAGDDLSTRLLR